MIVKISNFLVLCVWLLGSMGALATSQSKSDQDQVFDLYSTVQYTLLHSPVLRSERRSLHIKQLELKNSWANFLPRVDISSSHTVTGSSEPVETPVTSSFNVGMSENLYNNGQDLTNYRISKLQFKIASLTYQDVRDRLIRTVVNEFLNLSLQRQLFEIQQSNVDILKGQYNSALVKYREGLTTRKDLDRFNNQVQRAEISILQAKNSIAQAKRQLLVTIGFDLSIDDSSQDSIRFKTTPLKPIEISTVPTTPPSLNSQYQYKIFALQKRISVFNVSLERRNYWPQVNLSGQASYANSGQEGFFGAFKSKKVLTANATLQISYNLFDAGTQRRNIIIAEEANLQTVDSLQNQLLTLQSELDNLMYNLEQNKLSYLVSSKLQESELDSYKKIEIMYREGKISYLDLNNAISNLLAAKTQFVNDRYFLERELYNYYYRTGKIYEKFFK